MADQAHSPCRRSFFRKALLWVGALALTPAVRKAWAGPEERRERPVQGKQAGYRLTEHIRKYYETAMR